MDTPTANTHVSLCAGYGGIDIGLKRAIPNLRTVAFSEIEGFACANLVAKMEAGLLDPAPIWTNLKTFPWGAFRDRVDILSGGYPCQPFSAAGKRLGTDDPRHLWPYIADGIRIMQPRVCFFENVEGHISLGLRAVVEELGSLGYEATWGIFSAREVGAPHQRKRVFILAYRNDARLEGGVSTGINDSLRWQKSSDGHSGSSSSNGAELADSNNGGSGQDQLPPELRTTGVEQSSRCSRAQGGTGKTLEGLQGAAAMANSNGVRNSRSRDELGVLGQTRQGGSNPSPNGHTCWPSRPGEPQHEWEPPRVVGNSESQRSSTQRAKHEGLSGELCATSASSENIISNGQIKPSLGGDADGVAGGLDHAELYFTCDNRTDELRLLGNGVVPATATLAFLTLIKRIA